MSAAPVTIENGQARVTVLPGYGARVVGLLDKASGRDWMAPGGQSPQTGEDAVYLADEAVGWDECFPTVSVWDGTGTSWGRRLRDHGDLWGRPWTVTDSGPDHLATRYATTEFAFSRTLRLDGATLHADYHVENTGRVALPFMWALHGLLAVTPADRLLLPGIGQAPATYLSLDGKTLPSQTLAWPGPSAALPVALDRVQPASVQMAAKLYVDAKTLPVASIGNDAGWLDLGWDLGALPHAGLWLNYGGWPSPGDGHHLAVEATTAPVDHLGQALDAGTARHLAPGATAEWSVNFTLRH